MKKLIKLLNEYDDNNWGVTDYWALFNKMDEWISETEYLQVISKKFWFIKRLVENDKIDLYKVRHHFCVNLYAIDYWDGDYMCEDYEIVIAVLSISDNPISDLISYLK